MNLEKYISYVCHAWSFYPVNNSRIPNTELRHVSFMQQNYNHKKPSKLMEKKNKITMAMTGFMKCFVPKKARVFLSLQFQENLKLTPVNLTPSTYKPPRHFGAGISPFFFGGGRPFMFNHNKLNKL